MIVAPCRTNFSVLSRTVEREIERVSVIALGATPLNSRRAVAVDHDVDVGRIGIERLAEHDPGLAVRRAFTQKLGVAVSD